MKIYLRILCILLTIFIYGCGPECTEIIKVEQELKDLPNTGATFYKKMNHRKKWVSLFNKMGFEKYNSCNDKIFKKSDINEISIEMGGINGKDLDEINKKLK